MHLVLVFQYHAIIVSSPPHSHPCVDKEDGKTPLKKKLPIASVENFIVPSQVLTIYSDRTKTGEHINVYSTVMMTESC